MTCVQPLRWDLDPAVLAPGEGVWVLLEDTDAIPPVLAAEVQAQDITCSRGTQEIGKGAGAPLCQPWKYHIVYLRVVLRLTDLQPYPVYCRLSPMHATTVFRHRSRCYLNSTLWARDPSSETHAV